MRITNLLKEFLNSERSGGLVLLGCTAISLLLANSSAGEAWSALWDTALFTSPETVHLPRTIAHWINDGLMSIFFLLVGLEIRREVLAGELQDRSIAILPVAAALGGMLVPAALFFFLNNGTPSQAGIGIPMATDIAFALGMLSLLGNRVPFALKVFLSALAIIDDLGAIVVIALFYSHGIDWFFLLAAGLLWSLLFIVRRRIKALYVFVIPGILLWYCLHRSGIHATISGVLLALVIPFGPSEPNLATRLQHLLHKPVAFVVLPLFALANTSLVLSGDSLSQVLQPTGIGIILGLVLGKPLGIVLFTIAAVRLKWGKLPPGLNWTRLTGMGCLAGIGFTMSVFIANLAFTEESLILGARIAILVASLFASLIGLAWLYLTGVKET